MLSPTRFADFSTRVSISWASLIPSLTMQYHLRSPYITNSSGIPLAFSFVRIVPLCIVLKALLKSMNIRIASRCLSLTLSISRLSDNI